MPLALDRVGIGAILKRGMTLGLLFLPGIMSTLFVFLAIANGGERLGLSAEWLPNSSLLAVLSLTIVVLVVIAVIQQRNP